MRIAGCLAVMLAGLALAGQVASEPIERRARGQRIEVREFEMAYTAGKAGVTIRLTLATGRVVEHRVDAAAEVETVARLGAMFVVGRTRMFADVENETVLGLQVAGPSGRRSGQ
jgi:hypothetical protein